MQCEASSYSRLSTKCQKCAQKDYCNNKRMEAYGHIIPGVKDNINSTIEINIGNTNYEPQKQAITKILEQKMRCGFVNKS